MPNNFKLSISPIKRSSLRIGQSPPTQVAHDYQDRLIHTGLISSFVSGTQFKSLSNPIPSRAPVNSSGKVESPLISGTVNPKGLKYVVRIESKEGDVSWRTLVSLEDSSGTGDDDDAVITINTAISTSLVGARWDVLYPVDDGVRYISTISDIANSIITGQAGANHAGRTLIAPPEDFNLAIINKADNTIQVKAIVSLTQTDPATFTVASDFSDISVDDIMVVYSPKWTGFSNPFYDPYDYDTDLVAFKTFLTSINTQFKDAIFSGDVVLGDGNAIKYPVFDYEANHESGEVFWYGNSITGIKGSEVALTTVDNNVSGVDPGYYSTGKPLAPYNSKFRWSGTALGSTNFVTEEDAQTLTEGIHNANSLHHHDSHLKSDVYIKTEVDTLLEDALEDYYLKTVVDTTFTGYYTKTEVDNQLKTRPLIFFRYDPVNTNDAGLRSDLTAMFPPSEYKDGQQAIAIYNHSFGSAIGQYLYIAYGDLFVLQNGYWSYKGFLQDGSFSWGSY
jgi:hypothetical protein